MKKMFTRGNPGKLHCAIFLLLVLTCVQAFAQAPDITYPGPNVYTVGTAIASVSPSNSGGAVPARAPAVFSSAFSKIGGVATDVSGNVFVSEQTGNVIKKIPAGGGAAVTIASGFNQPSGLAVDVSGNVYVGDYGNNAVKKIAAVGGSVTTLGSGFSHPFAVALDASGRIYVSDAGNNMIKRMPAGGGTPVSVAFIGNPGGLAVDAAGNIYVADRTANAIKKVSASDGSIYLLYDFPLPCGVAVDASANVYFGDAAGSVIEIPASDGTPIVIATNVIGSSVGNMSLAIDGKGNLYPAAQGTVDIINTGGYAINKPLPAGLTFDHNTGIISGTAWLASPAITYTITGYNSSGSSMATLSIKANLPAKPNIGYSSPVVYPVGVSIAPLSPVNSGGKVPLRILTGITTRYGDVNGIAVDTSGNIFVGDIHNNIVQKLPVSGGAAVTVASGFNDPRALAVDSAGNVFAVDYLNSLVKKIPVGGGAVVSYAINGPTGVAVDAADNIYTTDNNFSVHKLPTGGGAPVTIGSGNNGPIAADAAGNVYLPNRTRAQIIKIPVGGSAVKLFAGTMEPSGVAVDAAGNVYFTDDESMTIKEIPISGAPAFPVATGFDFQGFAIDRHRNFFVSESGVLGVINAGGYSISPVLPAGLSFDAGTGIITGRPTKITPAANYTITTLNGGGIDSTIVRIGVTSADLTALKISSGILSPVFSAGTSNYADTVANTVSSVGITPTATDPAATIKVNGTTVASGSASGNIPLSVGANAISTVVTGAGGAITKTYTITVTRRSPVNSANLTHLALSQVALSPAFTGGTTNYTATVANGVTSTTVKPTTNVATSTITVNGVTVASGTVSGSIPLNVGANTINTIVTAQDGITVKTYTVSITRLSPANSTNLTHLVLSGISLSPAFTGGTTSYTASVASGVTSTTVKPTTNVTTSTITVNGLAVASGIASGSIPLNVGANTITMIVTAQDGVTTKTYTVTVTRAASSIATLSALAISTGTLSPAFAGSTTGYTAAVANTVASVTLSPTATDGGAAITINGAPVTSGSASGSIALSVGANTITTLVTASDGTTTDTYTITVTRVASANANIVLLRISSGTLSPTFAQATTSYAASVTNAVSSITVTPTANDAANATITVNGTNVASGTASGAIALSVGDNTITAVCTAQNGPTTKTYTVVVTRAMAGMNSVYEPVSVVNPANTRQPANDIMVHQGLSPNGDGDNDFLVIDGISNYPDNELLIMSRTGDLVFEVSGYNNHSHVFDGHSNKNGKMQSPGTYFYSLDYKAGGIIRHKTGFIVLKW